MKRHYNVILFQGIVTRDTFWDRKVLKLVQEQLGGRVHTIACGAAPINPEVKVISPQLNTTMAVPSGILLFYNSKLS